MLKMVLAAGAGAVIGAVAVSALTWPRLHRHYAPKVAYADLAVLLGVSEDPAAAASIDCWGDSLTEASSASPGHDFPSLLRNVYHRQASNRGVAGQTSAKVKARLLSSGGRDGPGRAIIWVGRNDDHERPDETLRNIADMVGSLPAGSHYLVLGVPNADAARERRGGDWYGAILALNQKLAAAYGGHYVPIREILIAHADLADVDDRMAVDADVVPPSLRTDALHLDDQGEAVVATAIDTAIRRGAW